MNYMDFMDFSDEDDVSDTDLSEDEELSDKFGIGYTIVSLTVPGVQGIADKEKAEAHATEVNSYIADKIKDHRNKLGVFACLSMHDPAQAAAELRRCVKELGMHGALL